MKKIVALLFLSFFVSTINAATMPMDLNRASTSVVASGHDHCQEGASVSHHESSKSSASTNATHSCCAVVAILITSPAFSQFTQVDVYLLSDIAIPVSNIAESIYKPPRTYL